VPRAYLADGERFVVVASNGASIGHLGGEIPGAPERPCRWERARCRSSPGSDPDEHAALRPWLTAVNPFFAQYVQITSRRIPVVLLEPRR
jgi:hypothetical protein